MVLRMTGAREPSLAMTDTEHIRNVHFLSLQRPQEITEDRVCFVGFCLFFLLINC